MSVARHTTYNFIGAAVPLAVTLITVPLYLQLIGFERYGLLAICWTLLGFLGFLNLGMGPAVVQQLAKADETHAAEKSQIVWTALAISAAMGLAGSLLVVTASHFYFDRISGTSAQLRTEIADAIPWLALGLPVSMVIGVLTGALQGLQRFGTVNLVNSSNAILVALFPFAAGYLIQPALDVLVAATAAVNACVLIAMFAVVARAVPLFRPRPPRMALVRQLASYGGWMSATALLAPAVTVFDRFLIGALKGPAAVSAYVIPYNLVSRVAMLPTSLSNATLPRFARADEAESGRLQDLSILSLLAVLTPISVFGIGTVGPFLRLWIGSDLPPVAATAAIILIGGFWVYGLGFVSSTVLMGRGRPDLLTKLLLAYLLPYFALLYILTDKFGVVGAAIAWVAKSACDPLMLFLTKPGRASVRQIVVNGAVVSAAVAAGLAIPTATVIYPLVMAGLVALSCAVNWPTLAKWLSDPKAMFGGRAS